LIIDDFNLLITLSIVHLALFIALGIGHFALSIEHCHEFCGSPIGCGASVGRARL